ncbi:hypothetical protein [Sphingomonas jatrophae]|uniref:Lipoprotein n=1 Tax=Sphingomonas jatrophae TaxID=1166337 RepID=A0A1I6L471_9SPHN|nr:hypothetical protein [Sphingomonas jatrophae]SFR98246.1 hypothetical protein SAMN05192580_2264 [Sphingomonas jatrophae]
MRPNAMLPLLVLAACSGPAPTPSQTDPAATTMTSRGSAGGRAPADGTAQPLPTDAWIGRWTGPEGLFVDIAQGGERGRYRLTIKGDLDSKGDAVTGVAEDGTIRFERNGVAETLRAGEGAATGLKWLEGKKHCLVVKPGEGFCRD